MREDARSRSSSKHERSKSDGDLLTRMGTDAALWADGLVKHASVAADRNGTTAAELLTDPEPGGFLHGWLCSAIAAGEAAGTSRGIGAGDLYRALLPMTDGLLASLDEDDVATLAFDLHKALQAARRSAP